MNSDFDKGPAKIEIMSASDRRPTPTKIFDEL